MEKFVEKDQKHIKAENKKTVTEHSETVKLIRSEQVRQRAESSRKAALSRAVEQTP